MQHRDVLELKTPLERSLGYARKINELAVYDCGLTLWMDTVKSRGMVVLTVDIILSPDARSVISPPKEAAEFKKLEAMPQLF